jgi:sugar/nucleoside kinase (ribokinase family)
MPQVLIIGSIGLDDVKTPFGEVKNVLGGSISYAAYSASFFAKPAIVAVVGEDFPNEHVKLLEDRGICLKGLKKAEGKTFRWQACYEYDMNEAKTLKTELNTFATFKPKIPEEYKNIKYIFLGNIDPDLQLEVLEQINNPKLIIMDTMNLWIDAKKDKLLEIIKKIDILLLNDSEARQLFNTVNLVKAANKALSLGIRYVIIKKGEHGALLFNHKKHFNAPGYPLENIKDPTGCGDSFGGGFIGYLAKTKDSSEANIRKAIIYGSVMASYNAEDFSLERMKTLKKEDIEKRYKEFQEIREF